MVKVVFVDTSAIAALLNKNDFHHVQARDVLKNLEAQPTSLLITNYIRTETHALLLHKAGYELAAKFLESKSFYIEWADREDENKAIKIIRQYNDKSFSLTDSISFAVMQRLGITDVFAYDRHFEQYGFNLLK
ncbi:MAG: type II toxin-antitoxin system VapC family toxin [Dethiobacteria bacterium]